MLRQRNQIVKPVIGLLLLLQLLVHAVVPAGFMPVQADGGFVLVICTPEGLKYLADSEDSSADHEENGGFCSWMERDVVDMLADFRFVDPPWYGGRIESLEPVSVLVAVAPVQRYLTRAPPFAG